MTSKQSLHVDDLIFALALKIEVESHRANQFTSVLKYWYILEYNYICKETTINSDQKETWKSILPCCASDKCVVTGTLLPEKPT